ncbi:MAG: hypothetical protein DME33_06475 [Verrucomicrobia bacterium]|nr:MAG: hypothetical protein DME33_06475 [Verrucomicrobiota bacterium]
MLVHTTNLDDLRRHSDGKCRTYQSSTAIRFVQRIASLIRNRHRLWLRARESDGWRAAKEAKALNRAGIEGNCGPNLRGEPAHEDLTLQATLIAARWKL